MFFAYGEAELACLRANPLSHRMFHLDTCIHLHKVEVSVRLQKELNGSCIFIMRRFCRSDRSVAHFLSELIVQRYAGGLFDQFLMVSLNGTVTLAQVHHISKAVRHDLEFHMTGMADKALHIHCSIAESHHRFLLCGCEG